MTTGQKIAQELSRQGLLSRNTAALELVTRELDREFERIQLPNLETSIQIVAANMHAQGRCYLEIGVHPVTKEVGYSFEPVKRVEDQSN